MSEESLHINGIEFYGYHGDLPQERELGQRYTVDLALHLRPDQARAGASDHLQETINYASVVQRVEAIGRTEQYRLIEALAERIASVILEDFSPREVDVRVTKPHPPLPARVRSVSVEIKRRL